jgi:hypothetical protein
MKTVSSMWQRTRRSIAELASDCRGLAATEFAFIVPLMLVMFFGTVEFSSGVAVDRKVSLMARTLADLTSQDTPRSPTRNWCDHVALCVVATADTESGELGHLRALYRPHHRRRARAMEPGICTPGGRYSRSLPASLIGTDPTTHAILQNQYFLFSEISFQYLPTIGYVMAKAGVNLSDVAYTRPRQSMCVFYPPSTTSNPPCPTS